MLLPVLLGITLVTFVIVRSIPGDPCIAMLGERANEETCAAFRERFGLDDNILVQAGRYLASVASGDLQDSIAQGRPVSQYLSERLPMTLELTVGAMVVSVTAGLTLGIVSALLRNSAADVSAMTLANVGVSMPVFWLGLVLAYFFAIILRDTPLSLPPGTRLTSGVSIAPLNETWGFDAPTGPLGFLFQLIANSVLINATVTGNWPVLVDAVRHLIVPSLALGTIPLAIIARMTRSSLLEVLGQDYIRTARAKGLIERLVIARHALRNALVPIVTVIGLQFGSLLGGAVLTETVFSLPGVGTAITTAIFARDYPVVQGFTLAVAFTYVLVNLAVDFSYTFLDPRIRLG
jgi:peptide/nickel transport system permease protein